MVSYRKRALTVVLVAGVTLLLYQRIWASEHRNSFYWILAYCGVLAIVEVCVLKWIKHKQSENEEGRRLARIVEFVFGAIMTVGVLLFIDH